MEERVKFNDPGNLKTGLCALAVLGLGACASTPEPVLGPTVSQPRADLGQQGYSTQIPDTYQLRPADVISVNVFREPDFSLDAVRVGVGGNISVPMIGTIEVAGLTTEQLEQQLRQRLSTAGLRDPMVSVNVAEYASHLVTVDGAVENPGVYDFQPGARLSSAIALANGTSRVADSELIAVFRETPEGLQVARFDLKQINQGTMLDPVLQPSDRVFVGTDGLAQAQQDLLQSLPLAGIFVNAVR